MTLALSIVQWRRDGGVRWGQLPPGRRRRGGAAAAPGEGSFFGEDDFVAML